MRDKLDPRRNVAVDAVSENAILLTWPECIEDSQHQQILLTELRCKQALTSTLVDSIVSYNSLLLYYHEEKITLAKLLTTVEHIVAELATSDKMEANSNSSLKDSAPLNASHQCKLVEIPVYYGEEAGWDLPSLAKQTSISIEDIVKLHAQKTYRAYALGFTPGFCYLATVDEKISVKRKATPRLKVPAGAVAIAEQQTAVYPTSSPGGWHIIGQTPIPLYSIDKINSDFAFNSTIQIGDEVKFVSIDKETFIAMGGQLVANDA